MRTEKQYKKRMKCREEGHRETERDRGEQNLCYQSKKKEFIF